MHHAPCAMRHAPMRHAPCAMRHAPCAMRHAPWSHANSKPEPGAYQKATSALLVMGPWCWCSVFHGAA
jgi:hypothetical protein